MNIRCKFLHWLPRTLGVGAITLYPYILFSGYPSIHSPIVKHEMVHVAQIRLVGWFQFYLSYIMYYLAGKLRGKNHEQAYFDIPYEADAYIGMKYLLNEQEHAELRKSFIR